MSQKPAKPQGRVAKKSVNNNVDPKETFLRKVVFCSQIFDFNDEGKFFEEKKQRLQALKDIQDTIIDRDLMSSHVSPNLEAVINMIKVNIFRPLPIVKK